MHVIAEITYLCPAKCPFCPITKKDEKMNLYDFKRALDLFSTLSDRRLLTISGGEPTTSVILHRFVKAAKDLGYTVTVATNCYYPDVLLKANPDFVQISVDGVENYHNTSRKIELWYKILKVLELIKQGELKGFIRYTLMKHNVDELYMLRQKLNNICPNIKIFAMPVRNNPELSPSREQILSVINDRIAVLPSRCPAGKGQFVITPDMRVLDCIFHREVLGKLENFDEEELEKIIENGRMLKSYPCGELYWWAEEAIP